MSDEQMDDLIKARFERLKAEQKTGVPDFAEMYARAEQEAAAMTASDRPTEDPKVVPLVTRRRHWLHSRWPVAAGTLAAAALAGIMLLRPNTTSDAEFEALVTAFATNNAGWQSPTDELLKVPGMEFVNSIPVIGGPYGAPLDTPDTPRSNRDVTG